MWKNPGVYTCLSLSINLWDLWNSSQFAALQHHLNNWNRMGSSLLRLIHQFPTVVSVFWSPNLGHRSCRNVPVAADLILHFQNPTLFVSLPDPFYGISLKEKHLNVLIAFKKGENHRLFRLIISIIIAVGPGAKPEALNLPRCCKVVPRSGLKAEDGFR